MTLTAPLPGVLAQRQLSAPTMRFSPTYVKYDSDQSLLTMHTSPHSTEIGVRMVADATVTNVTSIGHCGPIIEPRKVWTVTSDPSHRIYGTTSGSAAFKSAPILGTAYEAQEFHGTIPSDHFLPQSPEIKSPTSDSELLEAMAALLRESR